MGLESSQYINNLVSTNPTSSDFRSQGDDHIRNIKSAVKNTFPNAARPFQFDSTIALQEGDYTPNASTSDGYVIPVSARDAVRTVTLPLNPGFDGLRFVVVKADFSINAITISGNGNTIDGKSSILLDKPYQKARLTWSATTSQWFAEISDRPAVGSWIIHSGSTAPEGYVIASDKTIGNGSSGATARANEDCLALYQHLWNNYSNTICPVTGGRGASALADFDAGKTMGLLDIRGRTLFHKDNAGGSTAGRIVNANSGFDGTSLGASGGNERVALLQSDLPNVTLGGTTNTTGAHTHTGDGGAGVTGRGTGSASAADTTNGTTSSNGNHSHTITTNSINGGVTQTYVNKMPPAMIQLFCLKL